MISRAVKILVGAAAIVAMACVDIASPTDRPTSISLLQVPEFFVVVNDVMRDTLGNATAPSLVSFNGAGDTISGFKPSFFITDSIKFASFNVNGVIFGNTLGTAHAIGQIGTLQTPSTAIYVTVAPATLANSGSGDTTVRLTAGNDSASSLTTVALAATLRGAAGAGATIPVVPGGIVFYSVQSFVPSKPGSPAVFLTDGSGNVSTVDTSDASGLVSRTLVINTQQVNDAALISDQTGTKTDSVVVTAHITYKRTVIPVRFIVRVKGPFAQ